MHEAASVGVVAIALSAANMGAITDSTHRIVTTKLFAKSAARWQLFFFRFNSMKFTTSFHKLQNFVQCCISDTTSFQDYFNSIDNELQRV